MSSDKISSVPNYGTNGFVVNQTGQLDIMIEYGPQKWFDSGIIIVQAILIVCLLNLVYIWMKNENGWKCMVNVLSYISNNYLKRRKNDSTDSNMK